MTRMTGMCNLINTYIHTHHAIQTRVVIIYIFIRDKKSPSLHIEAASKQHRI